MDNEEKLSGSLAAIFNEFTEYAQADQDIRDQVNRRNNEIQLISRIFIFQINSNNKHVIL